MNHSNNIAASSAIIRARVELGQNANEGQILSHAQSIDPGAFKNPPISTTPSKITAAMCKAVADVGESASFQHVWARAAEIDPKAFEEAEDPAQGTVRKDTLKKLATLEELAMPQPWDQLYERSGQIMNKNPEMDEKEAFKQACKEMPLIYQLWQDSQPDPS